MRSRSDGVNCYIRYFLLYFSFVFLEKNLLLAKRSDCSNELLIDNWTQWNIWMHDVVEECVYVCVWNKTVFDSCLNHKWSSSNAVDRWKWMRPAVFQFDTGNRTYPTHMHTSNHMIIIRAHKHQSETSMQRFLAWENRMSLYEQLKRLCTT